MTKEKAESKWQIFIMLILIPLIFVCILAFILLNYTGKDEQLKQSLSFLPFIDSPTEIMEEQEDLKAVIAQLQHEVSTYISTIDRLEEEVVQKNEIIAELEDMLLMVQEEERTTEVTEAEEPRQDISDVVKTLEAMSASKASPILSEMEKEEAVMYLRLMKVDARSQVLSKMNPSKAAELLSQLTN